MSDPRFAAMPEISPSLSPEEFSRYSRPILLPVVSNVAGEIAAWAERLDPAMRRY